MTLRYLFCVVSADDDQPNLGGWAGEGAPLALVRAGAIAGVVGAVDEARFGEESLARAMQEVRAVAPYARAHQEVVQHVFERAAAVVPLAFGSVHHGDDEVRGALERDEARLTELLDRFRGMQEWSLRLARRRGRPRPDEDAAGAGAAYLALRRAELRGELGAAARAAAQDLDRALAAESASRRVLAESSGDLVLRAAYLVPREHVRAVKEAVLGRGRELEAVGLGAELSGPWPAYSFVTREAVEAR